MTNNITDAATNFGASVKSRSPLDDADAIYAKGRAYIYRNTSRWFLDYAAHCRAEGDTKSAEFFEFRAWQKRCLAAGEAYPPQPE